MFSLCVIAIARRKRAKGKDTELQKKAVAMAPIAQSSDNSSFVDDEDEATNFETSPEPAPKTAGSLVRRASSSRVFQSDQLYIY